MVKAPRIMPKASRIMPKEPRIMLKSTNKMSFDHLQDSYVFPYKFLFWQFSRQ
jgi:hypothetical protein